MKFEEFPKIGRLSRNCIITEKIDGSNAQIEIITLDEMTQRNLHPSEVTATSVDLGLAMLTGSRTRYITPGADNFGFARWAYANAGELFKLGPGRHFGEWWGSGIQRGYGLQNGEKRFSLFNVSKWDDVAVRPLCCHVVPTLAIATFNSEIAETCLATLREHGSLAAPGFMKPEGIVVFHTGANVGFKKTLERDDEPKSRQTAA